MEELEKITGVLSESSRRRLTRKEFIKKSLEIIIAFNSFNLLTKITFEKAKKEESLREKYLSQTISEINVPHYITNIPYIKINNLEEFLKKHPDIREPYMITVSEQFKIQNFGKKRLSSIVYILPKAFKSKNIISENDFINALTAHEFKHAENYYAGFKNISIDNFRLNTDKKTFNFSLIKDVDELIAFGNAIDVAMEKKNITSIYGDHILSSYASYYLQLWDTKDVNKDFIKELKVKFFREFIRTANFGMEGEKAFLIDRKGKKYYLPREIK